MKFYFNDPPNFDMFYREIAICLGLFWKSGFHDALQHRMPAFRDCQAMLATLPRSDWERTYRIGNGRTPTRMRNTIHIHVAKPSNHIVHV